MGLPALSQPVVPRLNVLPPHPQIRVSFIVKTQVREHRNLRTLLFDRLPKLQQGMDGAISFHTEIDHFVFRYWCL